MKISIAGATRSAAKTGITWAGSVALRYGGFHGPGTDVTDGLS